MLHLLVAILLFKLEQDISFFMEHFSAPLQNISCITEL